MPNQKVKPTDVWRGITEEQRVLDTSDGFHANVYRRTTGWLTRIIDPVTGESSNLPACRTDTEAKDGAMRFIAAARQTRQAQSGPQEKLNFQKKDA